VSATDVEAGQIEYFYSGDKGLCLDHIVASGSLPPSFPMTVIGEKTYWDGGLFDNTPLGAVLDRLDTSTGADRTIYVVNLFPRLQFPAICRRSPYGPKISNSPTGPSKT
jgi:NTE family protein